MNAESVLRLHNFVLSDFTLSCSCIIITEQCIKYYYLRCSSDTLKAKTTEHVYKTNLLKIKW